MGTLIDRVTLHTTSSTTFHSPVDAILTCGGGVEAYIGLLRSRPRIYMYIGGFTRRLLELA